MSWVEGRVERVLWAAQDGGWAVLRVRTHEGPMIVVGALGSLATLVQEGEEPFASFEGELEQHAAHGWQFKATGMLLSSPRTDAGVRLYLGSSGVHGIGPAMANRIVAHFGADTTRVLEREPERLGEVPGIGEKRAGAIAEAWAADAGGRALTILLRGLGLSGRLVERIRARYGDEAYAVITAQPYRLAEEVGGIGFALADRIARGQGMAEDHPDRIAAAVRHVVQRASDDGHCYLPVAALARGLERLSVPANDIQAAVDTLVAEARLEHVDRIDEPAVAVPQLADAERLVASLLAERASVSDDVANIDALVDEAQTHAQIQLDASQRAAVVRAATSGVTVVTGGPGTGKTTLVRVLLKVAAARGEQWALASPTGRAAKRLAEATGQDASTLHRLLEFQPATGRFGRNGATPLEVDGLVVDETSMVDVKMMAALLDALPWTRSCRLVLVGDADQLPSVGPGQVLRDLVDSEALAVVRLAHVHRQGARSGIVAGAAQVHAGRVPVSGESTGQDDFFLVAREDPEAAQAALVEIVTRRLPAKGFDPIEDVQVLTPTRKGPLGAGELNEVLRAALNPTDQRVKVGGRAYGKGDRVMCTRNRYDLGVFNGDLGRVIEARADGLVVRFDDATVPWPRDELDQIELAYAVTVHKSQGSEYPAVVLVLHRSHAILLRRNLFYTAITRARRFFCCIGDPGAWAKAVSQQRGDVRYTTLASRLVERMSSR